MVKSFKSPMNNGLMVKNRFTASVLLGLLGIGVIFFSGCRPVRREISLSPNRVVTGMGDVTLHIHGRGFESGMKVRVGERVLPATRLNAGELTCTLARESLLPKGSGAKEEAIAVCVLDTQNDEYSDTAYLTLGLQYAWQPAAAPPALNAGSGGPRLFALAEKTLLLVGRNEAKDVCGAVSSDSGETWGVPAILHAGEASDWNVRFVAHPATGVAAVTVTAAGIEFRALVGANGGEPALPAVVIPHTAALVKDLSVYNDRQGGLHVAWIDEAPAEHFTFRYAFSADGGANWTEPRQIREVINPQPGSYTLNYSALSIEGADDDGRIFLTARSSFNYRSSSESLLSRDHGLIWTVVGSPKSDSAGSAVSAEGTLVLGGMLVFGGYYPGINSARLNSSNDWETDWQEREFLGMDWNKSNPSAVVSLRMDRWDNLLLAAYYNKTSDKVMVQAFFRSTDAGTTWGPAAMWQIDNPMITSLVDLAIDADGNAFALFRGESGWLLFRALAGSE
jgi:hypothetical protein